MVMGHFVHAASFHYGEQISAQLCVGKKKIEISTMSGWSRRETGQFGEWQLGQG